MYPRFPRSVTLGFTARSNAARESEEVFLYGIVEEGHVRGPSAGRVSASLRHCRLEGGWEEEVRVRVEGELGDLGGRVKVFLIDVQIHNEISGWVGLVNVSVSVVYV